jgi:phosphoglucosamine mutase
MKKLFGTDGIRGLTGHYPFRSSDVIAIGRAAGLVLRKKIRSKKIRILAARDTRASGPKILKDLSLGLTSCGIDVYDAGVISTPAAAFLVKDQKFQSAVVISASHNPPEFNGIKFFNAEGQKWSDSWEVEVEAFVHNPPKKKMGKNLMGYNHYAENLAINYEEFLLSTLDGDLDLSGVRIAMDCSNGANFQIGPEVVRSLGAEVFVIGNKPSGKNINVNCGSQHTQKLSELVRSQKCHVGIAFDGDADRVMMLDEKGQLIDGDFILAVLAKDWLVKGLLKNRIVVTTVMANLGLKKALEQMKIKCIQVSVGDRFVSEAMREFHSVLGGEQSGHIILGRYLQTGDGLLTSLHLLMALLRSKKKFSELTTVMKKYPQVLVNVRIQERVPIDELIGVQEKIDFIQNKLGDNGRVLVRYSGTEPLLRIMLEGPQESLLNRYPH